jgi:hypothetical protein
MRVTTKAFANIGRHNAQCGMRGLAIGEFTVPTIAAHLARSEKESVSLAINLQRFADKNILLTNLAATKILGP